MATKIESFTGGCSTHSRKDVAFQFTVNGNKYSAAGSYISLGTGDGAGGDKTINGEFYIGQSYRGCKACGNKHLYQCCHCGSFVCYDGNAKVGAVCPVCKKVGDVPQSNGERICVSAEPTQIILAIDVSGSMVGSRLAEVKNAAINELIRKFPGAQFALVAFQTSVKTVQNFTTDTARIESAVLSLTAGGGTTSPLAHIKREFPQFLSRSSKSRRFLVILTDGEWAGNCEGHIHTAQGMQRDGINVIAIGCAGADRQFIASVASPNASISVVGNNFGSAFASGAQIIGRQK